MKLNFPGLLRNDNNRCDFSGKSECDTHEFHMLFWNSGNFVDTKAATVSIPSVVSALRDPEKVFPFTGNNNPMFLNPMFLNKVKIQLF